MLVAEFVIKKDVKERCFKAMESVLDPGQKVFPQFLNRPTSSCRVRKYKNSATGEHILEYPTGLAHICRIQHIGYSNSFVG